MRNYSIVDLLVDTYYAPISHRRRFRGGTINFAEKREDVYLQDATRRLLFGIALNAL